MPDGAHQIEELYPSRSLYRPSRCSNSEDPFTISHPADEMETKAHISLEQLLLVFAYNCLRNSIHCQLGDHRQLMDVLRRKAQDWEPQIGSEGLAVLLSPIYERMESGNQNSWQQARNYLVQRSGAASDISTSDVRDHLRYTLYRFDQISRKAFMGPPPPPLDTPLSERRTIDLINFSLSVVQVGALPPGLWTPDSRTLSEICVHLCESPMFPDGISVSVLRRILQTVGHILSETDGLSQEKWPVTCFPKRSTPKTQLDEGPENPGAQVDDL